MSRVLRFTEEEFHARVSARMSRPLPDEANPKPAPGVFAKNATTGEAIAGGGVDEDSHKQKGGLVKSKYRAVKTVCDGITFSSKAEAKRYQELKALFDAGHISDLKLQPVFVLADAVTINGRRRPSLRYVADFSYRTFDGEIVEDVKGMLTPVYRLKRHLMKSELGIDIVEITK